MEITGRIGYGSCGYFILFFYSYQVDVVGGDMCLCHNLYFCRVWGQIYHSQIVGYNQDYWIYRASHIHWSWRCEYILIHVKCQRTIVENLIMLLWYLVGVLSWKIKENEGSEKNLLCIVESNSSYRLIQD